MQEKVRAAPLWEGEQRDLGDVCVLPAPREHSFLLGLATGRSSPLPLSCFIFRKHHRCLELLPMSFLAGAKASLVFPLFGNDFMLGPLGEFQRSRPMMSISEK